MLNLFHLIYSFSKLLIISFDAKYLIEVSLFICIDDSQSYSLILLIGQNRFIEGKKLISVFEQNFNVTGVINQTALLSMYRSL